MFTFLSEARRRECARGSGNGVSAPPGHYGSGNGVSAPPGHYGSGSSASKGRSSPAMRQVAAL
eukprot:810823-Pyramimonas_sp.AAC.1